MQINDDLGLKTLKVSPKAILAFVFPLVSAVAASLIVWITDGSWDWTNTRLALAGLVAGGIASLGAYLGKPGQVVGTLAPEDAIPSPPAASIDVHAGDPPAA